MEDTLDSVMIVNHSPHMITVSVEVPGDGLLPGAVLDSGDCRAFVMRESYKLVIEAFVARRST